VDDLTLISIRVPAHPDSERAQKPQPVVEAAKARGANPSLFKGTSRRARYARGYHGLVGIGTRDQTVAAASPQVSGGPGRRGPPRELYRSRRTSLLPDQEAATTIEGSFSGMSGEKQRWMFPVPQ
jgi:hypothetical protein